MRTITYRQRDGTELIVNYDENAPCIVCGEPVFEASMGGTVICPWCDMGKCRYCGIQLPVDKGQVKEHMSWHKLHPVLK